MSEFDHAFFSECFGILKILIAKSKKRTSIIGVDLLY